ncbi:MAG: hypothetical protein M1818_005522 [Claussenomyces sp. TS43310]|nr:MAG: hypothetical protein M1818_005522 [Claussenomyces sp. TS43310]
MSTNKSPELMSAGTDHSGDVMSSDLNIAQSFETLDHQQKINGEEEIDNVTRAFGSMKVDHVENQTVYLGGAHWVSIMCEVDELRSYLVEYDQLENVARENGATLRDVDTPSSLLRGIAPPATQEDILSYIPARATVDVLVNRFFEAYRTTIAFIHEPTFKAEYINHWNDPKKTKIVWLGLLFAILHCAEVSYEESGEPSVWDQYDVPRPADFKALIVQCLIASDYTNPIAYTVETLMLYIQFDGTTPPDLSIETPLILGTTIRLAMRMGIHRNSNGYPGLTPFQDEMRRRLWAAILMSDTLHSFQLSLPATIHQIDCNCAMPRNIRNDEFGPDSTELPPPRSLNEQSEVTYTILKTRLLLVLKEIMNITNHTDIMSVEEIRKCETTLSEAQATIPPFLRVFRVEESTSVSASIQSQRIAFDRVYQLSRCMLYRKFLRRARTDPSVIQYRLSCVDAALILLRHQSTLFVKFNPMFSPTVRRRHKFTQPTLDFFVAGMIVALDLYYGLEAESRAPILNSQAPGDFPDRVKMSTALETSNHFWGMSKDRSVESAKAYGIFSYVLQKVRSCQTATGNGLGEYATGPDAGATGMEVPCHSSGSPSNAPEFNWDSWNACDGGDVDFEAFLQW